MTQKDTYPTLKIYNNMGTHFFGHPVQFVIFFLETRRDVWKNTFQQEVNKWMSCTMYLLYPVAFQYWLHIIILPTLSPGYFEQSVGLLVHTITDGYIIMTNETGSVTQTIISNRWKLKCRISVGSNAAVLKNGRKSTASHMLSFCSVFMKKQHMHVNSDICAMGRDNFYY